MPYQMQAASSVDGKIYTWQSATPDFAGVDYPGDGSPQHVVVAAVKNEAGGSSAVADDIAKNGGAAINRVRGINSAALKGSSGAAAVDGDQPPPGGAWVKHQDGSLRPKKPSYSGAFDPLDYGAKFDGETDDYDAIQACIDAMPAQGGTMLVPMGIAWMRDSFRLNKCVHFVGQSGKFEGRFSGFEFPPGKTGFYLDSGDAVLGGGTGGLHSTFEQVDILSHLMVWDWHGTETETHGLTNWWNTSGGKIRQGDVFVREAPVLENGTHANAGVCFRASFVGNAAKVIAGAEPSWNMTPGGTATAPGVAGVTFTTESIPRSVRQSNHTGYSQGDRVTATNDNRFFFECVAVQGSKQTAATPPAPMVGGDDIGGVTRGGVFFDGVDDDNGVYWKAVDCAGLYIRASYVECRQISVCGFTGPGIQIQAGGGVDAEPGLYASFNIASSTNASPIVVTTSAPHGLPMGLGTFGQILGHATNTRANGYWLLNVTGATTFELFHAVGVPSTGNGVGGATGTFRRGAYTYASHARLFTPTIAHCGMGISIVGSESAGFRFYDPWGIKLGFYQPRYDASGFGGHFIHDASLTGTVFGGYVQTSTGRPYLYTGTGQTCLFHLGQELSLRARNTGQGGTISTFGGQLQFEETDGGIVKLDTLRGRGIGEWDPTGTPDLYVKLTRRNGAGVFPMETDDDANQCWSWTYSDQIASGYWGFQYGSQSPVNAAYVSTVPVGFDPTPGWWGFPKGFLLGVAGSAPIFRGAAAAWRHNRLRSGLRKAGDRYESLTTTITVLADGYRGEQTWTAATGYIIDNATQKVPGSKIEPTANTGKTSGGEQVWATTTAGTSHATTEPTWPGSPTPGVTTQADNGATHTYLGATPPIEVEQRTEKCRLQTRMTSTQTTTATASQVIATGGVVDGVDLALPPSSMVRVTDIITVKKASTGDGGTIEITSVWVRNGTGAPTEIGTGSTAPTYNLSGSTLDGTTATHVANGNRIELQASPESADTLNWRVARTQLEGVD